MPQPKAVTFCRNRCEKYPTAFGELVGRAVDVTPAPQPPNRSRDLGRRDAV